MNVDEPLNFVDGLVHLVSKLLAFNAIPKMSQKSVASISEVRGSMSVSRHQWHSLSSNPEETDRLEEAF